MTSLTDFLDHYFKYYIDFIMLDDFNEKENNLKITSFLEQNLNNIIENKNCYKSMEGSCIDLMLKSRPGLHKFTQVFERGMSDHHLKIYAIL